MDIDSDGQNAWVPPIGTCAYATMSNTLFQVISFAVNGPETALLNGFDVDNFLTSPLVSVSRTNDMALDPRPAPGSALLTNVLTQTQLRPHETDSCDWVQTCYRGAFSEDTLWLAGWSGLDSLGVLAGGAITPTPAEPTLVITENASNVTLLWDTEAGFSYRLQSRSSMTGTWSTIDTIAGTGGEVMSTQPRSEAETYYRVEAE